MDRWESSQQPWCFCRRLGQTQSRTRCHSFSTPPRNTPAFNTRNYWLLKCRSSSLTIFIPAASNEFEVKLHIISRMTAGVSYHNINLDLKLSGLMESGTAQIRQIMVGSQLEHTLSASRHIWCEVQRDQQWSSHSSSTILRVTLSVGSHEMSFVRSYAVGKYSIRSKRFCTCNTWIRPRQIKIINKPWYKFGAKQQPARLNRLLAIRQ